MPWRQKASRLPYYCGQASYGFLLLRKSLIFPLLYCLHLFLPVPFFFLFLLLLNYPFIFDYFIKLFFLYWEIFLCTFIASYCEKWKWMCFSQENFGSLGAQKIIILSRIMSLAPFSFGSNCFGGTYYCYDLGKIT